MLRWWARWVLPFEFLVRYCRRNLSSGATIWEDDDWTLRLERKFHGETCFCRPCQRGRQKSKADSGDAVEDMNHDTFGC